MTIEEIIKNRMMEEPVGTTVPIEDGYDLTLYLGRIFTELDDIRKQMRETNYKTEILKEIEEYPDSPLLTRINNWIDENIGRQDNK